MSAAKRTFALPLMLLALLLQGLAPGVAAAATARMLDPFSNLPICSTDLNGAKSDHAPAQDHGQAACAACVVCQVPAALTADVPALPRPPIAAVVATVRVEIAGPRGPPRRAAQARAPPTQA
jgi:hypothetical protein